MQAYRAVTLIDDLDEEVRRTLELTLTRLVDLLGLTLGGVSQANTLNPQQRSGAAGPASNGRSHTVRRSTSRNGAGR